MRPWLLLLSLAIAGCGFAPSLRPVQDAPVRGQTQSGFRWSVNLHAFDVGYDLDQTRVAFTRIRGLGARMVRTDFDWNRLEPQPGQWDPEAIAFFDGYLAEARAQGLEVICILSQAPDWAMKDYREGRIDAFLQAFGRYSEAVAKRWGNEIYYYQYWNEPNRAPFDPIAREDDWQVFLHGDRGVRAADPNGHLGMINFTTDFYNGRRWTTELGYYMRRLNATDPAHTVRLIGIDPYPSTWAPGGKKAWKPFDELASMLDDPQHPCYGFEAAIMETGFSTYLPIRDPSAQWKKEQDQANWYRGAIPALRDRLTKYNASHRNRFHFVNMYELYDGDTERPLDPEAHFGIFRSNGSPKAAAATISELLRP